MSSFMPSFDAWQRALKLPLKVHAWHALLLAAAVAVLLASGTFLIYLNPKAAMAEAHWKNSTSAQIIFLGNSQQRSLDVKQFCRPALNISVGGSDYSIQYAILRNLAPRLPHLKVVVVGFDNLPLGAPAMTNRKGDYEDLLAWGVPWWDIPELPFSERFLYFASHNTLLKPFLSGPKLDQPELDQHVTWTSLCTLLDITKKAEAAASTSSAPVQNNAQSLEEGPRSDVHKVKPPYSAAPADGKRKLASYVRSYRIHNNKKVNREAFLRMARFCRDHNLQMVLLRTPTTKAFWSNRPQEWDRELDALYEEAVSVYGEGLPLWDEERTYPYEDNQFDDPNHLITYYTRRILTPRINQRLKKLFDTIPDQEFYDRQ